MSEASSTAKLALTNFTITDLYFVRPHSDPLLKNQHMAGKTDLWGIIFYLNVDEELVFAQDANTCSKIFLTRSLPDFLQD